MVWVHKLNHGHKLNHVDQVQERFFCDNAIYIFLARVQEILSHYNSGGVDTTNIIITFRTIVTLVGR